MRSAVLFALICAAHAAAQGPNSPLPFHCNAPYEKHEVIGYTGICHNDGPPQNLWSLPLYLRSQKMAEQDHGYQDARSLARIRYDAIQAAYGKENAADAGRAIQKRLRELGGRNYFSCSNNNRAEAIKGYATDAELQNGFFTIEDIAREALKQPKTGIAAPFRQICAESRRVCATVPCTKKRK